MTVWSNPAGVSKGNCTYIIENVEEEKDTATKKALKLLPITGIVALTDITKFTFRLLYSSKQWKKANITMIQKQRKSSAPHKAVYSQQNAKLWRSSRPGSKSTFKIVPFCKNISSQRTENWLQVVNVVEGIRNEFHKRKVTRVTSLDVEKTSNGMIWGVDQQSITNQNQRWEKHYCADLPKPSCVKGASEPPSRPKTTTSIC